MILTSHQPNFLPYMGFFYKAYKSDIIVLSDDVFFSKKGMHNFNFIYDERGPTKITLPVSAHHDSRLRDIKLVEPEYNVEKIGKRLKQQYSNAPHFDEGLDLISYMEITAKRVDSLAEFNGLTIEYLFWKFGIIVKPVWATSIGIEGHKDERILQMCKTLGADVYYSGTGAKVYHIEEDYATNGIELVYSDYKPVVYQQKGEFIENLSVVDWIFNKGFELPETWRL